MSARSRSPVRLTIALTLLAALFLPARAVRAETDAQRAEALIRQGNRLRAQDQAAQALSLFEEAFEISRTPRTAAQLGLCELELGAYVAAERHLSEALAGPYHPWIARNKVILKRELDAATAKIGELALSISPANARVSLNDKPVADGVLGAPMRLAAGQVEVEVQAPGYESAHATITIVGGQRVQRTFALVPEPSPAVGGAATALDMRSPPRGGDDAVASRSAVTLESAPVSSPAGARIGAWITAGGAVGALALGVAEAFNAASKRDAFNGHTGVLGGAVVKDCGTSNVNAACQPLEDSYNQAMTLSIVGFAAAGALAITSSVLFVLTSPEHAAAREEGRLGRAFACLPDVGTRGFGCALRF